MTTDAKKFTSVQALVGTWEKEKKREEKKFLCIIRFQKKEGRKQQNKF